jgi:hypothetical protein
MPEHYAVVVAAERSGEAKGSEGEAEMNARDLLNMVLPTSHVSRVLGLFFVCTLAAPMPVLAQELKPLDVVIDSFKSSGDLAHAAYLFQRCAGLYLALSRITRDAGNDPTGVEKLLIHSEELTKMFIETDVEIGTQRSGNDLEAVARSLQKKDYGKAVIATSDFYIERMRKNYLLTGYYFADDHGLEREMRICQSPMVALGKAIEPSRGSR